MTKSEEAKARKAFVKYLRYDIPSPKVSSFRVWAAARFTRKYDGKDAFPCLTCQGYGWIHDPYEDPDVNEGYKMVSKLPCKACLGTGWGPQAEAEKLYKEYRVKALRYRRDFLEKKRRVLALSKTLSVYDLEALKGWNG